MKKIMFGLLLMFFLAVSTGAGSMRSDVSVRVNLNVPKNANSLWTIASHVGNDGESLYVIDSYSSYSHAFYSGSRFDIPMTAEYEYNDIIYPKLNVYIVNNSSRTVNVSSLELDVVKSEIDKRPFFKIATCDAGYCYEMGVINQGYSNESHLELHYRILRKGETFNGSYDRKRVLSGQGGTIDLLGDLVEMGFDYKSMKANNPSGVEEWSSEEGGKRMAHRGVTLWGLSRERIERLFSPFCVESYVERSGRNSETKYTAYAPIYGELRCPGSGKAFKFKGKICMGHMGEYGAEMDEDDSFDVKLDENRADYKVKYPYYASIEPGGSVKVGLKIKCTKSSFHSFSIKANNENGLLLKSRDIRLQYFSPHNTWAIYNED